MKDGDDLWIADSSSPICLSHSRFAQLLIALSKRHGAGTAYHDALGQSVVMGSPQVRPEAGWMSALRLPMAIYIPSTVSQLIYCDYFAKKKTLSDWLKKEKRKIAFLSFEESEGSVARRLVKDWKASVLILESRGVILQAETPHLLSEAMEAWWVFERRFCQQFGYGLLGSVMAGASPLLTPLASVTYFAHAQILQERMGRIVEVEDGNTRLKANAFRFDPPAAQAFMAQRLLQMSSSALKPLPTQKPEGRSESID